MGPICVYHIRPLRRACRQARVCMHSRLAGSAGKCIDGTVVERTLIHASSSWGESVCRRLRPAPAQHATTHTP